MAQSEDEEEQYLATLQELEATQEDIANYQGLLKDLPEIYERKFNERLKPVLDRQQCLLDERENLLQQVKQALPASEEMADRHRLAASPESSPAPEIIETPRHRSVRRRSWWFMGLIIFGVTVGLQLHRRTIPRIVANTPSPNKVNLSSKIATAPSVEPRTIRERVVEKAIAEWNFFGQQTLQNGIVLKAGRQEGDPGYWQRVITYWREGLQNNSLTKRSEVISIDHPWSAAFIAFVMKQAGVGDRFPYAASHSGSIKEAIYNRLNSIDQASLIGHRISDYSPQPGDLICATRSWARGQVTYENANQFDFFPSRCELVIRTTPNQIEAIGGDLRESVTRHSIRATNGRISPDDVEDWLVVIQSKID